MTGLRLGSLFSGYAGLEMGVQAAIGGQTAWFSEVNPAMSKVLAYHWPHVPNLGDITTINWADVPPVDVMTGGSPCQDLSVAGRGAGMREGTRSGLWSSMLAGIAALRPALVVWENVRGALSACAHSDLEPCPRCVGGAGPHKPVLRALGRVLGDLADVGYDAQWHGLRAADIGAPHGRFREFVVARNANGVVGPSISSFCGGRRTLDQPRAEQRAFRSDGAPTVADSSSSRRSQGQNCGAGDGDEGPHWCWSSEPERSSGERLAATDSDGDGLATVGRLYTERRDPDRCGSEDTAWGAYEPAVRRWERLTRVVPAPTELGPKGGQRLAPLFVEWMQGAPEGHVTDPAIGISRNEQLTGLGNGVVPQQAAEAVRICLSRFAALDAA